MTDQSEQTSRRRLVTGGRILAVLSSLAIASVMVVTSSRAAFVDTTTNGPNQLTAGTVDLRDDDGGSVAFNVNNLAPGAAVERCIVVTYDGSLPANVRLYGSGSGALDPYLDLTIDTGTGGNFSSCAGFSGATNIFTGTLGAFRAETNYANGLTGWNGAGTGDARTYRIRGTLRDDNAAQGLSASVTLTWEAQNT